MSVKIKQSNPGAVRKLIDRYKNNTEIAIGLPKGTESAGIRYPDGTELLDVAYRNEFGIGVPERPFLRAGVIANMDELKGLSEKLIKKVNSGKIDMETAGEALGLKAASDIKNYITSLSTPPNSEKTIAAKGSSNPLVDTELLVQSITHEVRSK